MNKLLKGLTFISFVSCILFSACSSDLGEAPNLVDAATPTISQQPEASIYAKNGTAVALSVSATVSDSGTLSYQWYKAATESEVGSSVSVGSSYIPSTAETGITYYYVVVTNTNNSVSGKNTATVTSNHVAITVNDLVNAATPAIGTQPVSATYNKGASATALSVSATVSDSGTLSYQWYMAATESETGTAIDSATSATYSPATNVIGTSYYYCVVTNTNNSVNGTKTATATSSKASVKVNAIVNAATPAIGTQPASATYVKDASATALSVSATVSDSGTLSYQWYSTATVSDSGSAIASATSTTYSPATGTVGTVYYYCVVTNTNTSVNGTKTVSVTSNIATITVNNPDVVNAVTPTISVQPQAAAYNEGGTATALSVTASTTDGGTLSYQWYKDGAIVSGATSSAYTPVTTSAGSFNYYVVVTNKISDNGDGGSKTAAITSNTVTVVVASIVNAATPTIVTNPVAASYKQNATAAALSVSATVSDSGTLSYQWYSATTASGSGSTIASATSATYSPATTAIGIIYYYVIVTNTNNSVNGTTTATSESSHVAITVTEATGSGGINIQF